MTANLYAAWIGFLIGCLAGAVPGLFFHEDDWLGGYASWPRRMIRLAHIAFFGAGFLNLGLALTARALNMQSGLCVPGVLLIAGAALMPTVCYLSAWRTAFRHLFCLPALSITIAVALFTWRLVFL